MSASVNDQANRLATAITSLLDEFRQSADDEMQVFAVDCHPWNGVLALAFLTSQEIVDDRLLDDPREMAAWKFYDFGGTLRSSHIVSQIASEMRNDYERTTDRDESVHSSLTCCASAVASNAVQHALATFRRSGSFRITISHPDTDKEFFGCRGPVNQSSRVDSSGEWGQFTRPIPGGHRYSAGWLRRDPFGTEHRRFRSNENDERP